MPKKSKKIRIKETNLPENINIKFSFEFYDSDYSEYCLSTWKSDQISSALKRMKEVNGKTFNELQRDNQVYHFHSVPWEETNKKNGFPNDKVNELEAFQIALIGINGQKARLFGGYAQNTFYIVWFDLEHKIWPSFKKR